MYSSTIFCKRNLKYLVLYLPLKFRLFILKLRGAKGFEDTIFPPTRDGMESKYSQVTQRGENLNTYHLLKICRSMRTKKQAWLVSKVKHDMLTQVPLSYTDTNPLLFQMLAAKCYLLNVRAAQHGKMWLILCFELIKNILHKNNHTISHAF